MAAWMIRYDSSSWSFEGSQPQGSTGMQSQLGGGASQQRSAVVRVSANVRESREHETRETDSPAANRLFVTPTQLRPNTQSPAFVLHASSSQLSPQPQPQRVAHKATARVAPYVADASQAPPSHEQQQQQGEMVQSDSVSNFHATLASNFHAAATRTPTHAAANASNESPSDVQQLQLQQQHHSRQSTPPRVAIAIAVAPPAAASTSAPAVPTDG